MKNQAMTTEQSLMIMFGGITVKLEDVCENYLGMDYKQARRQANARLKGGNETKLPLVAFKFSDSKRAPWMVKVSDLAKVIDEKYAEAKSVSV